MNDRTIARIIEILETAPDFFVPVKKLWQDLQEEGLDPADNLENFRHLLEKDERFELISNIAPTSELVDHPSLDMHTEQEMETLGFYKGSKVKLVSRPITAEAIFTGMTRSLKRLNAALENAWKARPEDDQETEDQLLEILAAGQKLEQEIQGLLDDQDN